MKKILFAAIVLLSLRLNSHAVTLPFYDAFPASYGQGSLLGAGNSSTTWIAGNGTGAGGATVTSNAALTYSGLTDGTGYGITSTTSSSRNRGINFTKQTLSAANPTVYVSFLLRVSTSPSANKCLVYLKDGTGSGTPRAGVFLDASSQLHISKASSTPTAAATGAINDSNTHLVVLRWRFIANSSNDEVALWLDPATNLFSADELSVPGFTLSTATGSDATDFESLFVAGLIGDASVQYLDEVRVGLTWADVTPSGSCLPAAISGQPADTNVNAGATANFSVSATGSSRTYQWQLSTDNGASWNNVSTGSGGTAASYTTAATTGANNNNKFRSIVSVACDSSSVTSSVATLTVVCDAANISQGPLTQTSYIGYTASFNVATTGTARTYQWQLSTDNGASWNNVGTSLSNYTTATLTGGDNNSKYRCVVSVPCDSSSQTSSVATLTIIDPVTLAFRSATSGDWSSPGTWEASNNGGAWGSTTATPFYGNSNITVRATHTVTVTTPVTADDLTIENGGELDASGTTLTFNDGAAAIDCNVLGILQVANVTNSALATGAAALNVGNGGRFVWASQFGTAAIPTATWADGSTCEVANGNNTTPTGLAQSFYDFFWSRTSNGQVSLGGQLQTVRHNLTMRGSASAVNSVRFLQTGLTCNLTVGHDFIAETGYVTFSGGSVASTVLNLFLGGNFVIQPGAILDSRTANAATPVGSEVNIWFTNTATTQYFTNGGALDHTGDVKGCPVNWRIATGVTLVVGQGNISVTNAYQGLSDTVIVDGTLNLNGNQIVGIAAGSGALAVNAGGTLIGSGTAQLTTNLKTVTYGGTLSLPGLPSNLNNGDGFKLFDATSYSGAFTAITPSTTPTTGFTWDTTQLPVTGYLYAGSASVPSPHFTGSYTSGANFVAAISGGAPGGTFNIIAASDLALPPASWTTQASGLTFDGSGNYSYTNALGAGHLFYRITTP